MSRDCKHLKTVYLLSNQTFFSLSLRLIVCVKLLQKQYILTSEQCSSVMLQIAHQALRCQVYKHFLIQALFRNKPHHPFNNIVLEHEHDEHEHWAAFGMNRTPSTTANGYTTEMT